MKSGNFKFLHLIRFYREKEYLLIYMELINAGKPAVFQVNTRNHICMSRP